MSILKDMKTQTIEAEHKSSNTNMLCKLIRLILKFLLFAAISEQEINL